MMSFVQTISYLKIAMFMSLIIVIAGCAAADEDEDTLDQGTLEELPTDTRATKAWTGWTSEEYPPLTCPTNNLVQGVECHGGYCDNIRLDCVPEAGITTGGTYWTSFFSEEGTNWRYCGSGQWMTGLDCDGGWCDNISLACTQVFGRSAGTCYWSGYYSEESGPFQAPSGYYLRGMQCRGSRCDDMRYYYCRRL